MRAPDAEAARIRQQAAAWLTRRDAGWTADEAAEFAAWRAVDARHDEAARQVELSQHLLQRLPEAPGAAAMLAELEQMQSARPRKRRAPLWPFIAFAAAACLAVIVWRAWPSSAISAPLVYAAEGEPRTVALSDGSTVYLQGGGTVEVDLAPGERHVQLRRGEAHFAVAKDAARPFVVAAGPVAVRAVGTAFGVRRELARVAVLVTEGRVEVTRATPVGVATFPALLLGAGEATTIRTDRGPGEAPVVQTAAIARAQEGAWHAPRLEFNQTPLAEVIAHFNHFSDVQIELADPALASRPVGGTFDADQAQTFVTLLEAAGDIQVERMDARRIILRKAR
ncbi:FecR domain-containing protein [Opitutus sp. ER46]|uniref:FecR family protein n=1 Tax=Opitutus sp. ER46 TaxID=2161864 RepID=UPI000D3281B6|nr:FecR domain-containing protein [Opitutus sp. ER46]PTX95819.1 hypothetical protein DB354_10445 [Opitutus sp. ER46]